jgi:hypothetical protein
MSPGHSLVAYAWTEQEGGERDESYRTTQEFRSEPLAR